MLGPGVDEARAARGLGFDALFGFLDRLRRLEHFAFSTLRDDDDAVGIAGEDIALPTVTSPSDTGSPMLSTSTRSLPVRM